LEPGKLEEIKAALRKSLHCDDLIVHYHYKTEEGQMVQALKYITRSTFLDESWDYELAKEIYLFRNVRWWGDWKQEKVWEADGDEFYQKIADVEMGKCPVCSHKIHWRKETKESENIDILQQRGLAIPLGADIYLLAIRPGDSLPLDNKDLIKDIKRQQSLSGERQIIDVTTRTLKRRGSYLTDQIVHWRRYDIRQQDKSQRLRRSSWDPYWDDPNSEGFMDPSEAAREDIIQPKLIAQ
jgi:hypothetical protein